MISNKLNLCSRKPKVNSAGSKILDSCWMKFELTATCKAGYN